MYKILLTDDEQIVIDSLSFIINKNFEEQVQLFTSNSGTKALEIATKEDIDIIFMDINMPGLNGLDTVGCIKKLKPQTVIIILSAFDKFQYAQDAMNLGVYKYITKPVNRNIIIQTIRSAMDFVDNQRGNQDVTLELNKKLDFVSPMVENDFLYACIFNKDIGIDLTSYLEYFNILAQSYCFCCFEFPRMDHEDHYDTYLKIRDIINENQRCLVSNFMMNRIAVYYPVLDGNMPQPLFEEDIKAIYSKLSFNVLSGIRLGISKIHSNLEILSDAYKEAVSALNKTDTLGGISFYADGDETVKIDNSAFNNSGEIRKNLLGKIRQGDIGAVTILCELYAGNIFASEKDLNKVKNKLFELIVTAKNIVSEIDKDFESADFDNAFMILNQEENTSMISDFLKKMLVEFTTAINKIKQEIENPVISKVSQYVDEHLFEELSLEQMAEYAGVSSFYLSKTFKEEKGVNYIVYITDKRLEKAQKLLKETQLSIKEITAQVGYNDQNYFSRLFKNKFGISPSEFRK